MTIKKLKSIDIINVLSDLVSEKLETTVKLPYDKKRKTIIVNKRLVSLLSSVPTITKNNRKKKMSNPVIHDVVASLFLFNEICTSQVFKKKIFTEFKDFMEGRLIKNKEYFSSDNVFTSIYEFIKNVVDYLYERNV